MNSRLDQYLSDFLPHADRVEQLVAKGRSAFGDDEFLRYAAEALLVRHRGLQHCLGSYEY